MDECLLQPLCSMGGCAAPPRPSAEQAGEEQEADHVCCCKPANFRIFRPWKIQIGNFQKAGLKLWYLEAVRKVLWSALYGGGNTGTSRVLSIPAACQGGATDKQGAAESPPPWLLGPHQSHSRGGRCEVGLHLVCWVWEDQCCSTQIHDGDTSQGIPAGAGGSGRSHPSVHITASPWRPSPGQPKPL